MALLSRKNYQHTAAPDDTISSSRGKCENVARAAARWMREGATVYRTRQGSYLFRLSGDTRECGKGWKVVQQVVPARPQKP